MAHGPRSDWAAEAFGQHLDALRERIPTALATAHARARASHEAAQSKNLRVYGTALWELQHEELVAAVRDVPGAKVAKFGGYELPVVARKVLFPLRYTDHAGVPVEHARLPLPVSRQRQRLFGAHATETDQPTLFPDGSWADLELPDDYEVFPQLGGGTELVVVAYACSPEAGVLHIEWGHAEHVGNGELAWGEHSPLPLATPLLTASQTGAQHTSAQHTGDQHHGLDPAVRRFDAGAEPGLGLDLRRPEQPRAEGNH